MYLSTFLHYKAKMQVKEIKDISVWQNETRHGIVIVDVFASWCGPCRLISPEIEKLAEEYAGRIKFVKVDVDNANLEEVVNVLNVRALPTFKVLKDGSVLEGESFTIVGADVGKVKDLVARALI